MQIFPVLKINISVGQTETLAAFAAADVPFLTRTCPDSAHKHDTR